MLQFLGYLVFLLLILKEQNNLNGINLSGLIYQPQICAFESGVDFTNPSLSLL